MVHAVRQRAYHRARQRGHARCARNNHNPRLTSALVKLADPGYERPPVSKIEIMNTGIDAGVDHCMAALLERACGIDQNVGAQRLENWTKILIAIDRHSGQPGIGCAKGFGFGEIASTNQYIMTV